MEEVENKPTSSRNAEQTPQAETSQENTDIIAPIDNQSSIEASIDSLGDNKIPEHDITHSPAVTDFPEVESNSTNVSVDQPIKQDEYLTTDNSTSTSQEMEHIHQGTIAADINNRQQDGGSTVTASGDNVDNLITEPSTSSSITKEFPIEPIDSPRDGVIDAPQENLVSTSNSEVHVAEESHQEPVVAESESGSLEDIVNTEKDGDSTVSVVDNQIEHGSGSLEDIVNTEKDGNSTVSVVNNQSEHGSGSLEDLVKMKKDGDSTVSVVDNQIEPSASSSEKIELQNDSKELNVNFNEVKVSDVAGEGVDSPTNEKKIEEKRGIIDTASPFESVKEAVSKFGGIVDWKAHRMVTVERRKQVEQELEKAHDEIPEYRKISEAAEQEKVQALQELDTTKRLIEELKLNLERAQTEEHQARQDSELAKLRVEEMEQGIAEDSSVAAKAQLEVAKARYTAAITEFSSVKEELDALRVEYASLVDEKGEAINRAEEAVAASKQVERSVEDLTIELIATKESLETAHSAHMEAEEHRIGTVMARDQDLLNWEKELKQEEQELEKLNQKILSAEDLKSKLSKASTLLLDLKSELNAYMESKSNQECGNEEGVSKAEQDKKSHNEIQEAIASAKKELEEVKLNIEKATSKVNYLKVAATSLRSELEQEKLSLALIRQREGMASVTVASIEAELNKTKTEISFVHMKEKEGRETILEMPKKLKEAAEEANKANLLAEEAREGLRRIKEEAEQAKASASTMNSRLLAAQKEIEAARASERLAIKAIKTLQESESARSNNKKEVDSSNGVKLSVEEYYNLTKQAHEAEEEANVRVATANSEIDIAKENESKTLEKLNEVNKEMAARRESLKIAMGKAEKAREGKLDAEQELRKWRAEHGQRRKAGETVQKAVNPNTSHSGKLEQNNRGNISHGHHFSSQKSYVRANNENGSSPDGKNGKKKKKSFFPRVFMFFARRKSHSTH
ncbi:protein WEAK CHLOROPLAST MOVEMENT UNDER BLUE LIGHT 1-like [Vicia villosa]|uniref:protein WEAK CHLOROPLAST MOVEMENT UNDER BLUE LIGHT 1-like n=1 Tax=Vicia villosa TaxID=3911 RepID=UPI00273C73F5|nr:protein WEAK CHLOROPLAST MOVEMENT UNDER BLUE LIGHT 1-like [Vicia villosa]XP_058725162.1 protein WEAK CHLOROPLAST MOVEMENT UNDER BLUE LIGHT 1-like [Vicia villosa]